MADDNVKRINPLLGPFSTFEVAAGQAMGRGLPHRDDVLRDEWDRIVVDTALGFDTNQWETGVSRGDGGEWIIVEQYESRDDAVAGHAKWVADMRSDPERELRDIDVWGLSGLTNERP